MSSIENNRKIIVQKLGFKTKATNFAITLLNLNGEKNKHLFSNDAVVTHYSTKYTHNYGKGD